MRSVSLFLCILLLISCSDTDNSFRSTRITRNEPYTVSVVDPNDKNSFYYKLYDSLNVHISKINGNTLENFSGAEDEENKKDFVIGWLFGQFENGETGLGKKASSAKVLERTSDEFLLDASGLFSKDKVSFSVDYDVTSIPKVFLYPDLWKKAVDESCLEDRISIEREKYKNAGTFIRHKNGLTDTFYCYGYRLPINITLNYYPDTGDTVVRSTFALSAETAVYHQLRF